MNPALIIFGIQSVVRLGRVSNESLEQLARDGEAVFPEVKKPSFSKRAFVIRFFEKAENNNFVVGPNAPYSEYWHNGIPKRDRNSVDALFTAANKIMAERGVQFNRSQKLSAAIMVKQWGGKSGPISPWAKIILTAGDIVLEYVSLNPSLLAGGNGNGDKLIAAYAKHLSHLLPNNAEFGPKEDFAQRLSAVFLRAGLTTISENPNWVVAENHLATLISNTIQPLVKQMPEDITTQLKWRSITDALMGPVANAALKTLVEHQTAFLGEDYAPDKALGAIIRAFFLQAEKNGLVYDLAKSGIAAINKTRLLGLYKAILTVAAERPELFLKTADIDKSDKIEFAKSRLAEDMLSNLMKVLADSPPPFDKEIGIDLVAAALKAVAGNASLLANESKSWDRVAAQMVQSLAVKFDQALQQNKKLTSIFNKSLLLEFSRTIIARVAESPRMIIAAEQKAWDGIITAMANAMQADENLLLSGKDWLKIAAVAAEQAALNPERLFKLNAKNKKSVLAGQLMALVLKNAGIALQQPNISQRTVLYGKTLRETIITILQATSGRPQALKNNLANVDKLLTQLNQFVAKNSQRFGQKEWLKMFKSLLANTLNGEKNLVINNALAEKLLQHEVA